MTWDASDPAFMAGVTAAVLGLILLAIGMDMRRLPLGRIKWVPWSGITVMLFFVLIFCARTLIQDVVAR